MSLSISRRFRWFTRATCTAVIAITLLSLQVAGAATPRAVSVQVVNRTTAVVTGVGFPAGATISVSVIAGKTSIPVRAVAGTDGRFVAKALLPATYSGPIKATASVVASTTATPVANHSIPISPTGYLGNYNLSSASYYLANRFVLPADTTIDRWYFAVNAEGTPCVGGKEGYGYGTGGIFYGRIVQVNQATGLPTNVVLASEKINGCTSYKRAKDEFGLDGYPETQFIQFKPVSLKRNVMYAMVLSNVDSNPGDGGDGANGNNMSPNLDFAEVTEMGPNGRNNLSPTAPGAVYGLDPRETVMWSTSAGKTWLFGAAVGWYDNDNGLGKSWPSGYRIAGGANVPHGWPYMNWPDDSQATITITAKSATTLTVAGAASSKESVGVITVHNLTTGVTASTPALGSGLVKGKLNKPVVVAAGQQYSVASAGPVGVGSDDFGDKIFPSYGITYKSECSSCSNSSFRPMLYAQ